MNAFSSVNYLTNYWENLKQNYGLINIYKLLTEVLDLFHPRTIVYYRPIMHVFLVKPDESFAAVGHLDAEAITITI